VLFVYVELGSAPNAVLEGRKLVRTPFFSCLDDDDEYLPGTSDDKCAELLAHPEADLVITNSYRRSGDQETLTFSDLQGAAREPLLSLFERNWLNNGNVMFRSSSVGVHYFVNYFPYVEWTWLAFKLSMDGKKVHALDIPTQRVHVTPNSLSQSAAYRDSYMQLYRSMLDAQPPLPVRHRIERRMAAVLHDQSEDALRRGEWAAAMRYHVRSLLGRGGWQYLSYTRHLLRRPLARSPV
jgi:hypothetical protein